jgi:hypothetical protein
MKNYAHPIDDFYQTLYDNFNHAFENSWVIKPDRFIWHLTIPENRGSIKRNGILKGHHNYAVFANNIIPAEESMMLFWPLPIDLYDHWKISLVEFYALYDFWRIDTHAFEAEWRIDPVLAKDLKAYFLESPSHYICTRSNIPPDALKLYRYGDQQTSIKYIPNEYASIRQSPILKAA